MSAPTATTGGTDIDQLAALPVSPVRRPGQWIGTALVVTLLALLLGSVATNPNMGWPVVGEYLFDAEILTGIGWTVLLTVVCMALATVLGVVVAVLRTSATGSFPRLPPPTSGSSAVPHCSSS